MSIMKMICSAVVLAFLLIGCTTSGPQSTTRLDKAACPQCGGKTTGIPMLISGVPTKEMADKVVRGEALLLGCVGTEQQASVCLKCRKWKTQDMKYWQPLPKQFGTKPTE